jgi:hypothetical protein
MIPVLEYIVSVKSRIVQLIEIDEPMRFGIASPKGSHGFLEPHSAEPCGFFNEVNYE